MKARGAFSLFLVDVLFLRLFQGFTCDTSVSHIKPIDCNDPHELNQAICAEERQRSSLIALSWALSRERGEDFLFFFFVNGILSREERSELVLKWARCINLNAREYPIALLRLQMQSHILKLYVIFFFPPHTRIRRLDSDLTLSEFMHFFHAPGGDLI